MNRKQFIRNSMLGIGAAFMPKIFMPVGYTIKNRKDGETSMAMTDAEAAEFKLQHMIIKSVPPGKYIDLNYIKNALHGMD